MGLTLFTNINYDLDGHMKNLIDENILQREILEIRATFKHFPEYLSRFLPMLFNNESSGLVDLGELGKYSSSFSANSNMLVFYDPYPFHYGYMSSRYNLEKYAAGEFIIGGHSLCFEINQNVISIIPENGIEFQTIGIGTIMLPPDDENILDSHILREGLIQVLFRAKKINFLSQFVEGISNGASLTDAGLFIFLGVYAQVLNDYNLFKNVFRSNEGIRNLFADNFKYKDLIRFPSGKPIIPECLNFEVVVENSGKKKLVRLTDVLMPCLNVIVAGKVMHITRNYGLDNESLSIYTKDETVLKLVTIIDFLN